MERPEVTSRGGTGTRGRSLLFWLRIGAFAACLGLFIHALSRSNLAAAWERIRDVGPIELLILVPLPFALAADAWAWQRLLLALGRTVPLRVLFRVRLAVEAITNSVPVGVVWADAITPALVARRTGIRATDVFAASTAKRWLLVRMHGVYVAVAAALGSGAVLAASRRLTGNDLVYVLVVLGAFVLVLSSLGIETIAARGNVAARLSGTLARFHRVREWIEERHHHFEHADAQLTKIADDIKATRSASARMCLLWLVEGFETFLILRLLGAPLGLLEVMSFDAALSVLRSAAVFAPAGIGVQDVGYLVVLQAYGVPDAGAIGPAFVVLKRAKEVFWVIVGFVLLARSGRKPRASLAEQAA